LFGLGAEACGAWISDFRIGNWKLKGGENLSD